MSGFFDTNILIYGQQEGTKGDRARTILASGGNISVQVLNEFASVARRKMDYGWDEVSGAIDDVLALVGPPLPLTLEIHSLALALAGNHGFSFYDALIVAAALEAGCDTLFTEDLQHGRMISGLTIVNPFLDAAA